MKQWYLLTAWYWRMTRKLWWLVCGMMIVIEAVAILSTAGNKKAQGLGYDNLVLESFAWLVFGIAYCVAMGVSLRPTLIAQGKIKGVYTLATLPQGGRTAWLAQMACTALSLMSLIVWQLVLMLLLYYPATLLSWTQEDMQISFVRNWLMRALVPVSWDSLGALVLAIAAPCVLLAGMLFQRGIARIAAVILGAVGAGYCANMLLVSVRFGAVFVNGGRHGPWKMNGAVLVGLLAASVLWSMDSIRRAKWL